MKRLNPTNPAAISEMKDSASQSSHSSLPRWAVFACYGVVTMLLLLPLLFVQHPQSVDLPNHLARQFARNMDSPALFEYHWMLFPYLTFDALAAALLKVGGLYVTGRIILGMAYVIWVAAPVMLHRALWKEWSLWPLLAALVVYNGNTVWGFAAYSITAGAGVLLLSAWIMTERYDEGLRGWWRVIVFSVLAFLIYLGHLTSFAVFGLLIGGYELGKLYTTKQLNVACLISRALRLAPMGLPAMIHFAYISTKYPPAQNIETRSPGFGDRLATICSPFFDGLQTEAGHIVAHINYFAAFVMVASIFYLLLGGRIELKPAMRPVLAVLALLALVMPALFLGISFIHYRLPFLAVSLAIAASRVNIEAKAARVMVLAFLLALLFRVVMVEAIWQNYDREAQELIAKSEMIHPGNRVLVVNRRYTTAFLEHYHTGSFLVIERHAFVPNLFTVMHFFTPVGDYARLTHPSATHPINSRVLQLALDHSPALDRPETQYFRTWWRDFDYVVAWEHDESSPLYPAQMTPVAKGSFFKIYKVKKPG